MNRIIKKEQMARGELNLSMGNRGYDSKANRTRAITALKKVGYDHFTEYHDTQSLYALQFSATPCAKRSLKRQLRKQKCEVVVKQERRVDLIASIFRKAFPKDAIMVLGSVMVINVIILLVMGCSPNQVMGFSMVSGGFLAGLMVITSAILHLKYRNPDHI